MIVYIWLSTIIGLFLYSFTQIDLGLTLTRVSFWQPIQKIFQNIGYFQRPLSTFLYIFLLIFLFGGYLVLLRKIKKQELPRGIVWRIILLTAIILTFSYNAFSYDLFNYIFDARIITFYHQNPYQFKALDFSGDPMLAFMHWTHRTYPYGPIWLLISLPLSFLGWQKLLLTMLLFKILTTISYLLSAYLIEKILIKIHSSRTLLGLSIFAFNPLVIIESLVSAHNDILMITLALLAGYFLLCQKKFFSWFFLFLSIGIKFATGFLIPIFLLATFGWKKKVAWSRVFFFAGLLMSLALLLVSKRTEFQPWYLLYLIPLTGLLEEKQWLFWLITILSLALLLGYAPFLYLGNWNPPVPLIRIQLVLLGVIIGLLTSLYVTITSTRNEKNS